MLYYLLTLIIACFAGSLYIFVINPKRDFKAYVKLFESKGYKVYQIPFKALGKPFYEERQKDNLTGDGMKSMKEVYPSYDVCIANAANTIKIGLINHNLIKEFYSHENVLNYPKANFIKQALRRTIGDGIINT